MCYDTLIGERGTRLSGGRAGIASAILKDSPILILDEHLSELERIGGRSFKSAGEPDGRPDHICDCSSLGTIRRADKILVLEDGQIRESDSCGVALRAAAPMPGFTICSSRTTRC